jgi:hypothetical protein
VAGTLVTVGGCGEGVDVGTGSTVSVAARTGVGTADAGRGWVNVLYNTYPKTTTITAPTTPNATSAAVSRFPNIVSPLAWIAPVLSANSST